jgi:hypothetical protein
MGSSKCCGSARLLGCALLVISVVELTYHSTVAIGVLVTNSNSSLVVCDTACATRSAGSKASPALEALAGLLAPSSETSADRADEPPPRPSWVRHNAALAVAKIASAAEPGDLPSGLEDALHARVQALPSNDPYVDEEAAATLAQEHDGSNAGVKSSRFVITPMFVFSLLYWFFVSSVTARQRLTSDTRTCWCCYLGVCHHNHFGRRAGALGGRREL